MNFFRNPEIRKNLLCFLCITALTGTVAFLWEMRFGIFMLFVCLLFISLYIVFTYQRYKKIAALSTEIDEILHGNDHLLLETYAEGELSLLHSELCKMTVRLREQKQQLLDDKIYLADFIADISHQIRTPLTSVELICALLAETNMTDERKRALLHKLNELLSKIDFLITSLLKISKLDSGTVNFKTETLPMQTFLDEACAPLLIPMELRSQTLICQADGLFFGDRMWTNEAIVNIVKNCMEHTPIGGKIEIYAKETPLYTEITIFDNGHGIDKEDIPHIFERFYKGKNASEKSFGIGLALARMIVINQNGTIKAENRSEGGAKFTVRFYKGTV